MGDAGGMTVLTAVLLSAVLSAVVAIAVTLVIERWGGRIGGVLGTIPTTIVPAGIGLALASDEAALAASLAVVPYGMLINGCFLLVYVLVPPRLSSDGGGALVLTSTTALLVWSAFGALVLLALDPLLLRVAPMTLGLVGTLALAVMGVLVARGPRPAPAGHRSPGSIEIMARGLAAGTAIGLAVYLSGLGLPLLAGLSSVFPAIFLTTMVGLWVSQGPDVPLGAAGPMLLGSTSVAVYACLAMWSLPALGVWWGSAVAWGLSIAVWTLPCSWWVMRSDSAPAPTAPAQAPQ
ncbi:MAG: hypothetical protein VXX03_05520 [Candidatus Thermoplasmatota archaeon]|nr:hypothetical protein [Candidatus Thermoplasmatota archaeon]MEE3090601.1 hypothetical protein [Candidatus Thermoplasmatota archaeon]